VRTISGWVGGGQSKVQVPADRCRIVRIFKKDIFRSGNKFLYTIDAVIYTSVLTDKLSYVA